MNIFFRLGEWWERRRVVRITDLNVTYETLKLQSERFNAQIADIKNQIEDLKTFAKIPQTIAKEFALLNARLDRLELLTGLKREAELTHVKGAPRIE